MRKSTLSKEEKKAKKAAYDKVRREKDLENHNYIRRERYKNSTEESRKRERDRIRLYCKKNQKKRSVYRSEYDKRNAASVAKVKKAWRQANKEKIHLYGKKYRDENKFKIKSYITSRKSKMKASKEDILKIAEWEAGWRDLNTCVCTFCLKEITPSKVDIDHFFPLFSGGKHGLNNLSISCQNCNRSKSKKDPFSFIRDMVYSDFEANPPISAN